MAALSRTRATGTMMGITAVVIWSSLFAVTRSVIEQLGMFWSTAAANLIAGTLGLAIAATQPAGLDAIRKLPRNYLLGCGLLFVIYNAALYLALQTAANRSQVMEVTLVNYLWPACTIALMVPILGKRARITLLPGLALAVCGIYIGMRAGSDESLATMRGHILANPLPYVLALTAALSWGLYSNLSRRWAGDSDAGAVPVFLLATGAILLLGAFAFEPIPLGRLTPRGVLELLYLTIGPTLLAYTLWDFGMRKGSIIAISNTSFLAPLISTIINSVYLGVSLGVELWFACGLVILGAVVCKWSITDGRCPECDSVAS